jgi:hypothetical protein
MSWIEAISGLFSFDDNDDDDDDDDGGYDCFIME